MNNKRDTIISGLIILLLCVLVIIFVGIEWAGGVLALGFVIFLAKFFINKNKGYKSNLMATKPRITCKYIDTFYQGRIVYHIVKDTNTNKIYAIHQNYTNLLIETVLDKTRVLRNDKPDGFSTRKDWKEVNYEDTGSLWIDEIEPDSYHSDMHFYHLNDNYEDSLFNEATFVTGLLIMDVKY